MKDTFELLFFLAAMACIVLGLNLGMTAIDKWSQGEIHITIQNPL